MKQKIWKTLFPAICIPMHKDGSINEASLRKYVKWLASFDEIQGMVVNGHTGEVTGLSRAERKRVIEVVADEVGDKVTLISGLNCENTIESIEMAKEAKEAGADGILLMPPHMWLRFGMHPNAPFEYVNDVANGADIDIIIHLYPAISKAFYPVETLVKMCKNIPHVKAIKMGTRVTPLYENDVRVLRREAPGVSLITCHDESLMSSMTFPGMDGALIGFCACIPELITEAFKAYKAGDFKKIHEYDDKIFPVSKAIYGGGQPSGEAHARMKEALVQRGIFDNALMRRPVLPLSDEEKTQVANGLRDVSKVDLDKAIAANNG